MRLTTLGGSAAGPNPGQGCSGYLVESGPTQVVLDLGPGTLHELRRHVNFREIDAVVLSHLHVDHMLDILALRFALAYNPVRPRAPLPVWLPPGGLAFLDKLAAVFAASGDPAQFFMNFAPREFDPGAALTVGQFEIQFHPTVHYIPCWAMRLADGITGDLFFSADTGPAAPLIPFARGAHVILAEGTAGNDPSESFTARGHLTPAEAGELARAAQASVLVLTHLWAEDNPFLALQSAREAFGGMVLLASPGMKLTW